MPPKVGQRATGKDLPNTPVQPPSPKAPNVATGPQTSPEPPKAGPPKAAANLDNEKSKLANPVRATIHDLQDCDD